MKNYWSCSKFADWLRGTPKPYSGTEEEWRVWEKTAQTKKTRYWLAENGLDYLQGFLRYPLDRINDVRCYIRNRWIVKTHALSSKLKRGEWYDLDMRLLHACFDEIVNFVEIEQAWMLIMTSAEEKKKYKPPLHRMLFRMGLWRSPEAGMAYLDWAATLKNNEEWHDKNSTDFGQFTSQALAAQEILILYKWWKHERPKRPDPSEASGWSDDYEKKRKAAEARGDHLLWGSIAVSHEEKECSSKILNLYHEMENKYEEEDTIMLIRLIKVRRSLWT